MLPYLGKATAEHADTNKQCNFCKACNSGPFPKGGEVYKDFYV